MVGPNAGILRTARPAVDAATAAPAVESARVQPRFLLSGKRREYWARIGRGVARNRSFSEDRLAQFLAGVIPIDHLSLQEKVAAMREVQRSADTTESREKAAAELRAERQKAGLPSYTVDERYPDQLVCRYADGRVFAGHFEGSEFVHDEELNDELSPQRGERRTSAAR